MAEMRECVLCDQVRRGGSINGKWVCDSCRHTLADDPTDMAPAEPDESPGKDPVLIEKTSKSLKGQGCLASVGLLLGVVLAFSGGQSGQFGVFVAFSCLVWLVVVKALAWWRHG